MDDDPGEYISDRRLKIIEAWMDECIEDRCPGWEDGGELDIWGRGWWGDAYDADCEEGDEESWEGEDAWRRLDDIWGYHGGA